MICDNAVFLILMSLAFLTKVPQQYHCEYEGKPDPVSCTPKDFCTDPNVVSYKPDMGDQNTYANWILRYDLHCATGNTIGLIGSAVFIGWVAS